MLPAGSNLRADLNVFWRPQVNLDEVFPVWQRGVAGTGVHVWVLAASCYLDGTEYGGG